MGSELIYGKMVENIQEVSGKGKWTDKESLCGLTARYIKEGT